MTKKEFIRNSFEENNEKKLKSIFINNANGYNFTEKVYFLAIKNQLLLASCNMNENEFNRVLFKNYIYFLNDSFKANIDALYENNKDDIEIFNTCIENNKFEEAFNIFTNNNAIYQLLCIIYIKDLHKSEKYKASRIAINKIDNVSEKISLLKNTDLRVKREKIKVYQKYSAK